MEDNDQESVISIRHPKYTELMTDWQKYRAVMKSGSDFVSQYLKTFSKRETSTDFENRKAISYCCSHAKIALVDIKDAIVGRMGEVRRKGANADGFLAAARGEASGIDGQGRSMNDFLSSYVLLELLAMSRVGVYVDRSDRELVTMEDSVLSTPYIYLYQAEDILSWQFNSENQLVALLLRDTVDVITEDGLVSGTTEQYRLLRLVEGVVLLTLYDSDSEIIDDTILDINQIPFAMAEISDSLLTDIADYQIALTNIASSDINFCFKSNFPFYTEQYDPRSTIAAAMHVDESGNKVSAQDELRAGSEQGRKYPMGADRPGFIAPSVEPLTASMEKQAGMKADIRLLVNLTVNNLAPVRASADSRDHADRGLVDGLSAIGYELARFERCIATIWAMYTAEGVASVQYPRTYSMKSDTERLKEAQANLELISGIPSMTFQRAMIQEAAVLLVGHKVPEEMLQTIEQEINNAKILGVDPETIREDIESGILSAATASIARGYPKGEVEIAQQERAVRAAAVALAQAKASAQGVSDLEADSNAGKQQKADDKLKKDGEE